MTATILQGDARSLPLPDASVDDEAIDRMAERFAFIVQRVAPGKLTPHEARQAAEQRAEAAESAAKLAVTALEGAETSCRYHGETPPEAPAWHGGCESCRQPARVREALAAIRALTEGSDRG